MNLEWRELPANSQSSPVHLSASAEHCQSTTNNLWEKNGHETK